jgi:hypothetical protein
LLPAYPLRDTGSPPSFLLSAAAYIPRTESEAAARWNTAILQGPSLRSGLCCPGPSPLNRPHPSHSQAHRNFIALRLICDAFAVRERLGDPRVVPGFRCTFLPDMPSPKTPRSSDIRKFQNRDVDVGLHQRISGSALPMFPQSVSSGWNNFEASTVRPFATACQVARRPVRIWPVSQPTAPFTFQAFSGSVALPAAGYDYSIDWTPLLAGLSPAGMTASLAARSSDSRRNCCTGENFRGVPIVLQKYSGARPRERG